MGGGGDLPETLPASCRVVDVVGTETLIVLAAGSYSCRISAMEVEAVAILCSLAAMWADIVPIVFRMSLRVGSDSSLVTNPSSTMQGLVLAGLSSCF